MSVSENANTEEAASQSGNCAGDLDGGTRGWKSHRGMGLLVYFS